ncbi:MAG: primosomal protein N' [Dysgonamonadaceae bacterium]|jgi:primosomal protein N' (replication factor Y)|nr:primosomal protein N' [Dysgonamonadaceae bacterium]
MFVDVILPLPLYKVFTYSVPENMQQQIGVGFRIIVPFGSKKHYTAIVLRIHENAPQDYAAKEVHSLIDLFPVVNENQLKLWEWTSFYYICPQGDVFKAALPSAMKPQDFSQTYTPKTETYLRINPKIEKKYISNLIGRAKKQQQLFDEITNIFVEQSVEVVSKKELNASSTALKGLLNKQILQEFSVETGRLNAENNAVRQSYPLNEFQQQAFDEITNCFTEKNTCLLHGVTSSGKTEIYIHLIEQMLAEGRQTLFLVPEIALTTQLTKRLQAVFGNRLGIYHSKINDQERVEIWQKMLSDAPYEIMIGVRSSLFLPFQRLGLVIVDEEHEQSYKQQDPAPRYHARDTAIMLAHLFGAKTLLGSATPSIESYYNAKTGKYGLVTLSQRFAEIQLPEIRLENTKELRRKKQMKTLLAPALIEQMKTALANGEQVILFRNRRGFAPMLECKLCAWVPKCQHCDVSLTYHKYRHQLMCHYCNSVYRVPEECPACGQKNLEMLGLGTEQLEEEVALLFPGNTIARMDTDTTRGKNSYEKLITDFQEKRVQILVGTQMLSKGLDFDNVSVVGIISADSLLNYPDFRSHERGFQLMTQAAGRAGRKNRRGTVFIQTAAPEVPVYRYVVEGDYESFFNTQVAERKLFNYPPFFRLIVVVIKHKDENIVNEAADFLAERLKLSLEKRVFGQNKPIVSRVQQYHIREILLKLEIGLTLQSVRDILKSAEEVLRMNEKFRSVVVFYDVDRV